jgi:hypothetical protein
MWPTPYLEGADGSNEEDQVHIDIRKWFRKQLSLVSYLFVYVLHLKLCILHFCVLQHSSHIHSQVLCIPHLCICVHCWSVKRIRDVLGLTFVFLNAPSYILHSTVRVFALCMHFLFLQKKKFNFLNYILHYVYAFFVYASIFQVFKLHFSFYILCLCNMYAFFVSTFFICVDLFFLIRWLHSTLCLCMCVCAHRVCSFCSTLYRIFAIFILSFGCYLCVEVYHWRFEIFHLLTEK